MSKLNEVIHLTLTLSLFGRKKINELPLYSYCK